MDDCKQVILVALVALNKMTFSYCLHVEKKKKNQRTKEKLNVKDGLTEGWLGRLSPENYPSRLGKRFASRFPSGVC